MPIYISNRFRQLCVSAQIPDVDMVLHFPDLPGLPAPQQGEIAAAPPVFVTCTNANFLDIPFPDFTWWGTAVGAPQMFCIILSWKSLWLLPQYIYSFCVENDSANDHSVRELHAEEDSGSKAMNLCSFLCVVVSICTRSNQSWQM